MSRDVCPTCPHGKGFRCKTCWPHPVRRGEAVVHHLDRFTVVANGRPVQGEFNEDEAQRVATMLTEYDAGHGHDTQYTVEPL